MGPGWWTVVRMEVRCSEFLTVLCRMLSDATKSPAAQGLTAETLPSHCLAQGQTLPKLQPVSGDRSMWRSIPCLVSEHSEGPAQLQSPLCDWPKPQSQLHHFFCPILLPILPLSLPHRVLPNKLSACEAQSQALCYGLNNCVPHKLMPKPSSSMSQALETGPLGGSHARS